MKKRVVIIGGGFISSNLIAKLKKLDIKYFLLNRKIMDLSKKSSVHKLKKIIIPGDIIIFIAAKAPVKNFQMFNENILILDNVCMGLINKKFQKIIYISSDAVFADTKKKINEVSLKNPTSLHGLMHLYRENILSKFFTNLTIIRPTLIFGSDDPHNGYGPNSFIRLAQNNKNINLFGKGEEIRDHIFIGNVIDCIVGSIKKNIFTDINCVSSLELSFYKIVRLIKSEYPKINFHFNVRKSKMPHNGFRVFDNKKLKKFFPEIKFLSIEKWIKGKILYKKLK